MPKKTVRFAVYSTLGLILFVMFTIQGRPSSIDIRVDCGDLRFRYWGIPIIYERMREPQRTALLAIARAAPPIAPKWIPVLPQRTSNYNAGEYQSRYFKRMPWAKADPNICRLLLEDFSTYITRADGRSYAGGWGTRVSEWGAMGDPISPDWISDPDIRQFCESHGYERPEWLKSPTTAPAASISQSAQ